MRRGSGEVRGASPLAGLGAQARDGKMTLAERRVALQVRSAQLREQLRADAQSLNPLLRVLDGVDEGVRWLRRHPGWVAAAVAAVLLWRPRRLGVWLARLWGAWRLARTAKTMVQNWVWRL